MIDLHTHILPDWDDGAKDWDETLKMCGVARKDGIKKIALTPHVFRLSKYNDNLSLLAARISEFRKKMTAIPINFYFGAEVFVHHDMETKIRQNDLTINGSNYLFIEFPSDYIWPGAKDLMYQLMLEGYIPIISHPERNREFGERPDLLYELAQMGCLGQVTAKSIIGEFGHGIKKTADLFMANNLVHIIASDAHDAERRPPILSKAVEEAKKIVGIDKAIAMVTAIPQAILDDKPIPDYGEPINPIKQKKKWAIRLPKF